MDYAQIMVQYARPMMMLIVKDLKIVQLKENALKVITENANHLLLAV